MKNILFTNVKKDGRALEDDGASADVMVFAKQLTAEQLQAAFSAKGFTWEDCYEVPGDDLQFYLYDPCFLSDQEEAQALKLVSALDSKGPNDETQTVRDCQAGG